MLVDLIIQGKDVMILGGGGEAEMKALKLLDGGARVMIVGRSFNQGIKKLEKSGRIEVVKIERLESVDIFRVHRPYVVIIATSDADLNYKLFEKAREYGSLICVVDTPYLNDFNMPAISKIGDIRIAISTGGMSPAMSGLLRKRIEELIKFEDVLQVKLQSHIRNVIKKIITNFDGRKKLVYIIMNDKKIKDFLHRNKFDEAKEYAEKIVQMRIKKGHCT